MRITFLGTRGGIRRLSTLHKKNAALKIAYQNTAIIIDWGLDWIHHMLPSCDALLITHAHPDHAGGLTTKIPTPIYAVGKTFKTLTKKFPTQVHELLPRIEYRIGNLTIEPFSVIHSIRAPAVGYRISSETHTIWYAPDIIKIIDESEALSACDVYIGDGAIVTRTLLKRKKDHTLVGHAPIIEQLEWCDSNDIPMAYFSHCGTEIVSLTKKEHLQIETLLTTLYDTVEVHIAIDGLSIELHENI